MPNKAKSGFIQSESVVKVFEVRTEPKRQIPFLTHETVIR